MMTLPTIDCRYKLTIDVVSFISFSLTYCSRRCNMACTANDEARKQYGSSARVSAMPLSHHILVP